jgi:predicted pyridoxine 5'-phosphate oxidase superfamily flavin-nucleotide-binding protein
LLGAKFGVDLTEGARRNRGRSRPDGFAISTPLRARLEAALADDIALHAHVSREFTALAARHGV